MPQLEIQHLDSVFIYAYNLKRLCFKLHNDVSLGFSDHCHMKAVDWCTWKLKRCNLYQYRIPLISVSELALSCNIASVGQYCSHRLCNLFHGKLIINSFQEKNCFSAVLLCRLLHQWLLPSQNRCFSGDAETMGDGWLNEATVAKTLEHILSKCWMLN